MLCLFFAVTYVIEVIAMYQLSAKLENLKLAATEISY